MNTQVLHRALVTRSQLIRSIVTWTVTDVRPVYTTRLTSRSLSPIRTGWRKLMRLTRTITGRLGASSSARIVASS